VRPDRCPVCKRGVPLEWTAGWYCSRRYARHSPCDWTEGFLETKKTPADGGIRGRLPDTSKSGEDMRRGVSVRKQAKAVNRRRA
jgi:hypothetical protein